MKYLSNLARKKSKISILFPKFELFFYDVSHSYVFYVFSFSFVQDWVFYGVCHDSYGEFMIRVNDEYLRFRGKKYANHSASYLTLMMPIFFRLFFIHLKLYRNC